MRLSRRGALASALALAACGRQAAAGPEPGPLKSLARFPIGVAAMTGQFDDLGWSELVRRQFGRVTPEWEMKTEALAGPGGYDFQRPDSLVSRAEAMGLKVHGHTLVWYAETSREFERLDGQKQAYAEAYRAYVTTVAGRYRGKVTGWDAVNEPLSDDGALRDCRWRRNLGDGYIRLAFLHAREADPAAPLFLNDYDLETRPAKRAAFLRLAEGLLKAGAPLTGVGTQTHVNAALEPGAIKAAVADLASLGLPVHVSEFDVSVKVGQLAALRAEGLEQRQAALAAETVEAVMRLPQRQRYGITLWGARDRDSWLRRPPEDRGLIRDRPLLFDDNGRPKAAARAFAGALS